MRIPTKQASVPESSRLVGAMSQIKWESTELSLSAKTKDFFQNLSQMLNLISKDSSLDTFCSIILVVSLLRVIQCTALHPRLALLTGTVAKALDDLWHASLLILLLMTSFAGIATWRFGTIREDFASLEESLITNFMMMFGNFPDDWNGVAFKTPLTGELMVYVILYFIVVFLLMQNFLLAIVVEAYMAVAEENQNMETEQDFVSDICSCVHARVLGVKHGWPSWGILARCLESWNCKLSVGFQVCIHSIFNVS